MATVSQGPPVSREIFLRSLTTLRHRGPDGSGSWFSSDGRVALGHTRLAIVDPDGGAQPLSNEDDSVQCVVNGEFYDDARLRRELEAQGHRFRTRSDSEVLLHLYEQYGLRCVHLLRGEFAAVLWDGRNRLLMAVRDRFAIKPLVYRHTPDGILLASEAKALFAQGVEAAWDRVSLQNALTLQYLPPDRTIFEGVRQLEAGHVLTWQAGQLRIRRYWDLYRAAVDERPRKEGEVAEELEAMFRDAVKTRLRADVPVAFYLSGGIDSSAVGGFAKELGQVSSYYTVTFDESIGAGIYDEHHLAAETVDHLGGRFRPLKVSRRDLVDAMSEAVYHSEGLSINAHLPAKYLLSRIVRRDGFRVVLTGEGADEILLGYPHFRDDLLQDGNGVGRSRRLEALRAAHRVSRGVMLPEGETLDLTGIERRLGVCPSFVRAKAGFGARFASLLDADFTNGMAGIDPFAQLADLIPENPERPLPGVYRSSYLWTKLCLGNYILKVLGDGTEMAHSVEGRVPFLDHKLAEYIFALPLHFLVGQNQEKALLRRIAKGRVVEAVRRRHKHPFLTPPLYWPADRYVKEWFRDLYASSCPGFLDRSQVLAFLERERSDEERPQYDPVSMTMACLCLIQERFSPASLS